MSAPFETIIRPFESPRVASPRRIIPKDGLTQDENVTFTAGKNGKGKTFSTSYSYSSQRYMTKQVIEKTEINPNDDPFNANNDPFNANANPNA